MQQDFVHFNAGIQPIGSSSSFSTFLCFAEISKVIRKLKLVSWTYGEGWARGAGVEII